MMIRAVYVSLLALLVAAPQSTLALNQGFVVREKKSTDKAHFTREIGGKNHVAPQEVARAGSFTFATPTSGPAMMMFPKTKTNQSIVDEPKGLKIMKKFEFQVTEITPKLNQKPAWAVTPEQHGAALGWSGQDISGGKSFPVGY